MSAPPLVRAEQQSPQTVPARYVGVVSIAVFFGFFILGLMFHSALATSTYPAADDATELIVRWRLENARVSRISGVALSISGLVFAWFSAWFATVIHRTGRVQAALVTLAGGLLSALGLLLSGVLQWVAQRPENIAEAPVLHLVHQITFVLGGPMVVISLAPLVAVGGIALMRAKLLPEWLGWTGVVLGVLALGSVVMLLPEDGSLTYLVPLGRFLSLLWLTVVAARLARHRRRGASHP